MKVIFDLDGTLALIEHRRHFVTGGNKDWDAFHKACVDDELNKEIWKIFLTLSNYVYEENELQIWSGRSESVRKETLEWFSKKVNINAGYIDAMLLMRPMGDYTKDVELKRRWLHESIADGWRPDLVFDDRQSVVDMWREEGITCCQVAPGDFDNPRYIIPSSGFKPYLLLLVGPSGAGKSSFAKGVFDSDTVVSSDKIRARLCGTIKDQTRNKDVFEVLRRLVKNRAECGLDTIVDATNLKRQDRLAVTSQVPANYPIFYYVIDRPLEEKLRDGGWRNEVIMKNGKNLVEFHHERFTSQLPDILSGDNDQRVTVVDLRMQ